MAPRRLRRRLAAWLAGWSDRTARAASVLDPGRATPRPEALLTGAPGEPPEHWVRLVASRAPELLAGGGIRGGTATLPPAGSPAGRAADPPYGAPGPDRDDDPGAAAPVGPVDRTAGGPLPREESLRAPDALPATAHGTSGPPGPSGPPAPHRPVPAQPPWSSSWPQVPQWSRRARQVRPESGARDEPPAPWRRILARLRPGRPVAGARRSAGPDPAAATPDPAPRSSTAPRLAAHAPPGSPGPVLGGVRPPPPGFRTTPAGSGATRPRVRREDPAALWSRSVSATAPWPSLLDAGGTGPRESQPVPDPRAGPPWPAPPGGAPRPVAVERHDNRAPDRWPALPDDRSLWSPPVTAFPPARVRRLDDEQRGA